MSECCCVLGCVEAVQASTTAPQPVHVLCSCPQIPPAAALRFPHLRFLTVIERPVAAKAATQPKENKSLPVQMSQCARAPVQCDPHHFFRLHVSALADERLDHLKVPIKAGGVERRRFVLPTCKTDEGGTTGVNARAVRWEGVVLLRPGEFSVCWPTKLFGAFSSTHQPKKPLKPPLPTHPAPTSLACWSPFITSTCTCAG